MDDNLNLHFNVNQLCKKASKNYMIELEFADRWTPGNGESS